jgi:hypothetical protein
MVEKQDKRMAKSPAGYLVESIRTPEGGYKVPKGFTSRAERERREEARQAMARKEAEERRRKQQEAAREQAKDKRDTAYWASLTPEQQAQLQAEADAQDDPSHLAAEIGPTKRIGQHIRRLAYIRQMLDSREQAAEA